MKYSCCVAMFNLKLCGPESSFNTVFKTKDDEDFFIQ